MSERYAELQLNLLRHLHANPQVSQREIAEHLRISLGKANYCLRTLTENGLINTRIFKTRGHKRAYLYLLTPKGLVAKSEISARFLQRKTEELKTLNKEIEMLLKEVEKDEAGRDT